MSSESTLAIQRHAYEELHSQHQSARREHQVDPLKPLQQLNDDVQRCLSVEKNAYKQATEAYHQEFNILKRLFTSNASEHEIRYVLPLKEAYHQRKDLAAKVLQLLNETTLETNAVETRTFWNGAIAVVYNPITGRAEWQENWHGGVHGVFNPLTGSIEWKKAFQTGVYGVFNPNLNIIEWKTQFHGGIHGVYNPSTGNVEWKSAFQSGINGVYNPLTGQVEWNTRFQGGIVGYFDSETQSVKWIDNWRHGIALILWDAHSKTYLTTAGCGWNRNENELTNTDRFCVNNLCRLVHHTSVESDEDRKNINHCFCNAVEYQQKTSRLDFGPIEELVLYKDDQDQSLRRGFLIYKDVNHVDQAMSRRPHCLDNRPVHLQRAIPSPHRTNYQNPSEQLGLNLAVNEIFISRLGSGETRELFVNYFKSFGNIIDCRVFNSHAQNSQRTGYAFVRFADYDCVDRIILARPHVINSKFYHIRKCIPREYNYIVSSVKPISQSRPIWRHFAFGLINMKTQEITYPSLSTAQCAQRPSSSSGFTWVDPPALTVCVDRTVDNKASTNDFEVITTHSPSSSSISLINSTDDFTPLASPLYSTAIAYSPTPIDHEDRKLYELI